jgi:hypothetical protein
MYQTPEIFELGQAERLTLGVCNATKVDNLFGLFRICSG